MFPSGVQPLGVRSQVKQVKAGNWGQEEVFFPFRRTPSQRMLTRKTGEGRDLGEGAVLFFPFRRTTSQRTLTSKTGEGRDFLVQGPISGALNQNALYSSPGIPIGPIGTQGGRYPAPWGRYPGR